MSSIRRGFTFIKALLMLVCAGVLLAFPKDGAAIVIFILDLSLLIYGLRMLIYYLTMARYMVGGIMTLYKSIIVIDFGLFIFYMDRIPYRFMMVYLVAVMLFHSVTTLLGAFEMRRLENHSWKMRLAYGVTNMILAVSALFMIGRTEMVTVIYCIGLITGALYNIRLAFRKSAIIFIG